MVSYCAAEASKATKARSKVKICERGGNKVDGLSQAKRSFAIVHVSDPIGFSTFQVR